MSLDNKIHIFILCSMHRASYNMAIIIQQHALEYNLFKSDNCSTYFRWYFTCHQELKTLYLQYLALTKLRRIKQNYYKCLS